MYKISLVIQCAVVACFGSVLCARNIRELPNEQPTVTAAVAPILPPIARQARVESAVEVEVKIDESGNVSSAKVISGHPLVQNACETAARKWKFRRRTSVGTVRLKFSFDCVDRDKLAPDPTITFLPPYEVEVKY